MKKFFILNCAVWAALLSTLCVADTALERVMAKYLETPVESPFRAGLMRRMLALGYRPDDEDICPELLTDISLPPRDQTATTADSPDVYGLDSFENLRLALVGFDDRGGFATPDALKLRSKGLRSVLELLQSGRLNSLSLREETQILIADVVFYSANGMLFRLMTGIDEGPSDPFLNLENALMTDRYHLKSQRLRFELWTALYAGAGQELFAMFPEYFAARLERLTDMKKGSGLRFIPQFGPYLRGEVAQINDHQGVYSRILQKMSAH